MRHLFLCLLLALPACCSAADDIVVPEGYVLQPLPQTDGQIARPENWFYAYQGRPNGAVWTISRENPALGPYQAGMAIQLMVGDGKGTLPEREKFALGFIATKRNGIKVLRDCPVADAGQFFRQCIEVIEKVPQEAAPYHILYSVMWGKEIDMLVVTVFGAPPQEWAALSPIVDTMARFRLIGAGFVKPSRK